MTTSGKQIWALVGFLALCFFAAFLGSQATASSVGSWYQQLAKPSWNPPSWVFGPVWTLLYAMMAVAAWLVWRRVGWGGELAVFGLQLALNTAWSFSFFGWQNPLAGLVNIAFLWLAILWTLLRFWRVDPRAGWLLLPYLLWVSFAAALNFSIWSLNR